MSNIYSVYNAGFKIFRLKHEKENRNNNIFSQRKISNHVNKKNKK